MKRRCLGCGQHIGSGSRCARCRGNQKAAYADPEYQRLRPIVLARDSYTCQRCGRYANTVDHRLPLSKGGQSTMGNLQALCLPCNSGKRDR